MHFFVHSKYIHNFLLEHDIPKISCSYFQARKEKEGNVIRTYPYYTVHIRLIKSKTSVLFECSYQWDKLSSTETRFYLPTILSKSSVCHFCSFCHSFLYHTLNGFFLPSVRRSSLLVTLLVPRRILIKRSGCLSSGR